MKQFQIQSDGSIKLVLTDIPTPKENELLIKVSSIGINRADILQREGLYPAPNGDNVPGLEIAGIIEGTNRKVCALLESGGYSEYVCAKKSQVIFLEEDFDLIQAAALPEALTTVWMALFDCGRIKANKNILIHGGSSGIGSFAIQAAASLGCKVFTSTSNENKFDFCRKLGASFCFNYTTNNFSALIKENGGTDIIVDILGGKYLQENIKSLNKYGKLISLAVMDGSEAKINMGAVLMKNLNIIGTTLRSKPENIKETYIQNVKDILMPFVYSKKITPIIDSIYKFEEVEIAHNKIKSRTHKGKIILKL
ncbi:NAD(P)H-quinone oxidoreductase [Candidatus Jidaibacter acanthamoebae]|nr:NAD(P)H-quinone oxidoreductase [Candidatus Jidaibacter acanthamoeba]